MAPSPHLERPLQPAAMAGSLGARFPTCRQSRPPARRHPHGPALRFRSIHRTTRREARPPPLPRQARTQTEGRCIHKRGQPKRTSRLSDPKQLTLLSASLRTLQTDGIQGSRLSRWPCSSPRQNLASFRKNAGFRKSAPKVGDRFRTSPLAHPPLIPTRPFHPSWSISLKNQQPRDSETMSRRPRSSVRRQRAALLNQSARKHLPHRMRPRKRPEFP